MVRDDEPQAADGVEAPTTRRCCLIVSGGHQLTRGRDATAGGRHGHLAAAVVRRGAACRTTARSRLGQARVRGCECLGDAAAVRAGESGDHARDRSDTSVNASIGHFGGRTERTLRRARRTKASALPGAYMTSSWSWAPAAVTIAGMIEKHDGATARSTEVRVGYFLACSKYGLVPEAWSVTSTTRSISGTA